MRGVAFRASVMDYLKAGLNMLITLFFEFAGKQAMLWYSKLRKTATKRRPEKTHPSDQWCLLYGLVPMRGFLHENCDRPGFVCAPHCPNQALAVVEVKWPTRQQIVSNDMAPKTPNALLGSQTERVTSVEAARMTLP